MIDDEDLGEPAPLKLHHHELPLWARVFAAKVSSSGPHWAAFAADEAVRELRKRYNPNNTDGPYR